MHVGTVQCMPCLRAGTRLARFSCPPSPLKPCCASIFALPQAGATPGEAITPGSAAAPTPVLTLPGVAAAPTSEVTGRRLAQVGLGG